MFNDELPALDRIYRGPHMNFLVLGRSEIRTEMPEMPYLVISVTDPDKPDAEIAASFYQRAVLRLKFDDAVQIDIPGLEDLAAETVVELTTMEAQNILTFVRQHSEDVQLIVCQCEAGVSRSAAIAAALSRILQNEDAFFFENYWPNRKVYHTILAADA